MTREVQRDGKLVLLLEDEPPQRCELCGTLAETRPYGPNKEQICFLCGMLDEETTRKQCLARMKAVDEVSDS